ncbi:MAG: FKBP-type peptidyl-prolyl cis-trans isomerase [Bacteroidales bacterium]|jgi:FKBP-type peptidyl-prolyl cis-trans isomerase SlyD|nr:FKBP-type peptidyl-prolyl cis-trans isomerase [Bacteroidales bacterium]
MKVEKNKVIGMTYILSKDDVNGELVQEVSKDKPFVVLFGVGALLPIFEENLEGLAVGDTFSFALSSEEGYGEKTPEAIVDLDKKIFEVEGKVDDEFLKVGANIPMQNEQGHPLNGLVLEIGEDKVKMDFNHPLAGQGLYFTGEVVEVREASAEELEHGHVHGAGGHQH